jgi:hypothetical protein
MLAVILAPHGFRIARSSEATLSRGLRTIELLQSHATVGYEWQNTRLGPGGTGPTATCTTSCRKYTPVLVLRIGRKASIGFTSSQSVQRRVDGGAP